MREAKKLKSDYEKEKTKANDTYQQLKDKYKQKTDEYRNLVGKIASEKGQMEHFKTLLQMDWEEQEKKLLVKYGRGLLLFGPPGTGKLHT